MVCIVIVNVVYGRGMSSERQVHHVGDPEPWNHCSLWLAANHVGGYKALGDNYCSLAGLHLLLVVPPRAQNPGIAFLVCDLHLDNGDVGHKGLQHQPIVAGEGVVHVTEFRRRYLLQPIEDVGPAQGAYGNEWQAESASQVTEGHGEAAMFFRDQCPSLDAPIDTVVLTETAA